MDLKEIENLVKLMKTYDLHEIEVKDGERKIRLSQNVSSTTVKDLSPSVVTSAPNDQPAESAKLETRGPSKEHLIEVRSPFVGTFYTAPTPGAEPFVTVNKSVKKGETLCIVEAMKLMNEIEAERDGTIVEILVENEQPIEYNQLLFLLK